jgi:nucleoid-associated protein YgaU
MALQAKYQPLIDAAQAAGATNLQVRQQGNVLYIDGEVPSDDVKKQLWDKYNQIDPDYRSGDLVMNLNTIGGGNDAQVEEYTVVSGDSLSKIGQRYGISWQKIYEANRDRIKNPDLIQPGWKLKIPKA